MPEPGRRAQRADAVASQRADAVASHRADAVASHRADAVASHRADAVTSHRAMCDARRATAPRSCCLTDMDELDLRNTRGRLIKLGIAAAIGAVFTVFTMLAMTSSGRGNHDPVGASIMPLLGIFVFVLATAFAHRIVSRKR